MAVTEGLNPLVRRGRWRDVGLLAVGAILVVLAVAFIAICRFGLVPVNADAAAGLEATLAAVVTEQAVKRNAPAVPNPVAPTEANLMAGMKLYRSNCSLCHGQPRTEDLLGSSMYPPSPQFLETDSKQPDAEMFWVVSHGIRRSGMPSFAAMLAEDERWQIVTFIKHMHHLPRVVDDPWRHPPPSE